ncbi:MAG: RT0821/Lpp0805 family surface protein [Phaeospirillum sp.]|nr:RT0821/Lpp0805 family surface protein [Phaeospirillum sp.]
MRPVSSKFIPVVLACSILAACANGPTNQEIGTGVGAVAGGVIGSMFGHGLGKVAATAVGGLLGGWAGHAAGGALDRADKEKAQEAAEQAQTAPIGETVSWNNPDSGNSGAVTALKEGVDSSGNRCRDFQSTITVNGKDEAVRGTACRQPDGSWAAMR